jgi:hypothetical protein
VQPDTSPPSAPLAFFTFMMLLAPVTNWEPHGVTLAGYCYTMRHGMKVQIVTPYPISHLQRNGVTARGNIKSVYPRIKRDQHYALIVPLLYSTYWLLHVSAVFCHHQRAYGILLSYLKYKSVGWYIIKRVVILYSTCWLLHVSAVACHHQGAY